jgi:CHAD domain-containing protein
VTSFVLPEGFDPKTLPATVRAGTWTAADRRYYDTFDGRLHAAGVALARERSRLVLLDGTGAERAAAPATRVPAEILAGDLPAGPLRDELAPLIEMRALLEVARVKTRRRPLAVLDDERKTVVRLAVEEPENDDLHARLHVSPVRGYDKSFERVCRTLENDLGLARSKLPIAGEAMALAGRPPGGVSSKPKVPLERGEPAGAAAARISGALLEIIEVNLPGTLDDTDSEFLHDFRVAVRRTRALQRELRGVFAPDALERARASFKWLQQVSGPTRDLDVNVLDFDDFRASLPTARTGDLEPLHDLLVRRRVKERRAMVRALRSARTTKILDDWRDALDGLASGTAVGPDAGAKVERLAAARITRVYRRMVADGSRIDDDTPAEALHDLRKKGKELRYLLEFFAPLFPQEVTKPMVSSLKALQDTLGRFQDREVQAELIASLGEDIRTARDGARALMAMGLLVDRLEVQQAAAREEFAERFEAFASKRQRALVKETFG